MNNLTEAVKVHAVANYCRDGWDYVVECYEDSEIYEVIAGCETEDQAIDKMKAHIAPVHGIREDVRGAGGDV